MRRAQIAAVIALLSGSIASAQVRASQGADGPLHGLNSAELWVANNYFEIADACLGVEPTRSTWQEDPPVAWRLIVRVDDFHSPILYRITALKEQLLVERQTAAGVSLWDAALAAHQGDSSASPVEVAARVPIETTTYSSMSCPALVRLRERLETVSFGSMRDFRVATHTYRYRVDISKSHWFEGQLIGSAREEPDFNPPLVNQIVRLRRTLGDCELAQTSLGGGLANSRER